MDNMSVANDGSGVESVVDELEGLFDDLSCTDDSKSVVRGKCFSLQMYCSELVYVEKLQQLREEDIPTAIDFRVCEIEWTERIVSETIQTFQYYADLDLQWNIFTCSVESQPFLSRVVETATKLKLFRRFEFTTNMVGDVRLHQGLMSPRFATVIASAIRARHVEKVLISSFYISSNAMAVLATGLATAGEAVGLEELYFFNNEFESGGLMGASEYLAAGLASNTTLKRLCLDGLDDVSLGSIVQGVSSHPSLEELQLISCRFGRNTMQSIHRLLGWDGCRLRKLHMESSIRSDDANLNVVKFFVQDLPQNTSLESLTISIFYAHIDEKDFNLLLGNLSKLPNLRSLDLSRNQITDLVSFVGNLAGTMPTHRLRSLDLDRNPSWMGLRRTPVDEGDVMVQSILQLLEDVFPELGYLGSAFEEAVRDGILPPRVGLQLDHNRFFGLLKRGGIIPLSVWPSVMEKATMDVRDRLVFKLPIEPPRKATMLYEMLQGPAFGGRGSL